MLKSCFGGWVYRRREGFKKWGIPSYGTECRSPARGTAAMVPGLALTVLEHATGEADYQGTTEMWWDDQDQIQDPDVRVTLVCAEGHEWPADSFT
jgi:hypothetical protein